MEEFDFDFHSSLPKNPILRLAERDSLAGKENLVLLGPPSTGKTHCETSGRREVGGRTDRRNQSCPKRGSLAGRRPTVQPPDLEVLPILADAVDYLVGVDTHRDHHTAAVCDPTGAARAHTQIATDAFGFRHLLAFVAEHAVGSRVWAIEGIGSFGAGLTTFLLEHGEWVIEIDRPKQPARRNGAKSDELDAVRAACEALSRDHHAHRANAAGAKRYACSSRPEKERLHRGRRRSACSRAWSSPRSACSVADALM